MTRAMIQVILAAAVVCSTAVVSLAQQTGTSTETKTFEILAVEGNQLVVRLPEGTRELTVADDFRFNIDGKQLSVRELKPGMKGTATITTKTTVTPVTVTEVKNGTVVQSSGSSIIVRTDEGFKSFTQGDVDKRGVKIMRAGKPAQLSDFRQGDRLSATIITSKPPQVLTEKEVQATLGTAATGGAAAGGAAAGGGRPAGAAPAPSAVPPPPAPPDPSAPAKKTLPKTASSWPLLGLASVLSLAMGLALTARRRFVR
jgi:hypothetical protein